ncbi:hypothetical protein GCM10023306_26690 [Novosphingobium ginsenosidimutans]
MRAVLMMQQRLQAVLRRHPVELGQVIARKVSELGWSARADQIEQAAAQLFWGHGSRSWRCFTSRAGFPA